MFGLEQFLQTRAAIFVQRSSIINIGIGTAILFAAANWFSKNTKKIVLEPVHVATLALIAFAFLSQIWTSSPGSYRRYFQGAIPYFVVFFVLAPLISLDKNGVKQGVRTAMFLGIPLVFLFVFVVTWEGRGIRLAAPVLSRGRMSFVSPPLALASMAGQTAILSIILISKNKLIRLLQFAAFAMATYVAFRTQSRGQLTAMTLVTLVCYPLANQGTKLKRMLFSMAGFVVLAGILYVLFNTFETGNINRWTESSIRHGTEGRLEMSRRLLEAWATEGPFSILFGLGVNSSFHVAGFYVHILPAEILGEYGLLGMSLFLFIYINTFAKSVKIVRKLEHYPELRTEAIAIIALFVFSSFLSLKEGSLYGWPQLFFYAIAISHLERHSRKFMAQQRSLRAIYMASFAQQHSNPVYQTGTR